MKKLLFTIALCVLIFCTQGCKMKQKTEESTDSITEVTVDAVDAAKPLPEGVSYELQAYDIMLNQK